MAIALLILYGVIFFKKLIKKVGIMGNQDLFIVIVLTGFIFIIIYVIKHPTNKSSSSSSGKLMEADNVGMRCDTAIDGKAYFLSLFQKEPEQTYPSEKLELDIIIVKFETRTGH